MGRIFRYTIAGALGATIAWLFMEPTALMPDYETSIGYTGIFLIGLITGALIGLAMGIVEGNTLGPREAVKSIVLGTLVGAIGGVIGLTFGNAFYSTMHHLAGADAFSRVPSDLPAEAAPSTPKFLSFCLLLLGRGFGWSLIGMFIGISQGIATSSTKKMTSAAIGGFIGGGIGGVTCELLSWMNKGGLANFAPGMIRFIGFSVTGAAIGLFIGSIEELARQAWLVRVVGLNEGKNYDLYKSSTVIGRSEMADIPVFTDPDVAERHAVIVTEGKSYAVQDLGTSFGTTVNGAKITKDYLRDGDEITVGKTKFVFRDKATASTQSALPRQVSSVQIPTSEHVCQFCGSVKDAAGNCACSVGGQAASQPMSQPPIASSPFGQSGINQPGQMTQQPMPQQTVSQQPVVTSTIGPFSGSPGGRSGGPRLVGVVGPYAGQEFSVKTGETQIGREPSKDIGLPNDTTTSRNHAKIAQEIGCYVIYDLGSTNGTSVNGARIQRKELNHGDFVQIGNTKFRFEEQ